MLETNYHLLICLKDASKAATKFEAVQKKLGIEHQHSFYYRWSADGNKSKHLSAVRSLSADYEYFLLIDDPARPEPYWHAQITTMPLTTLPSKTSPDKTRQQQIDDVLARVGTAMQQTPYLRQKKRRAP